MLNLASLGNPFKTHKLDLSITGKRPNNIFSNVIVSFIIFTLPSPSGCVNMLNSISTSKCIENE